MISHLESYKLSSFLDKFRNVSLVNKKGELLFSKDADPFKTTTSRLVSFQIVKKYLQFNVGDIFISNDPENGGTSLSRIFFMSCLSENLFLIWDKECLVIDYKIPLSPLVEKHQVNKMLWTALVEDSKHKDNLSAFFLEHIDKYNKLFSFNHFIKNLSSDSYQKQWFKITSEFFNIKFDQKALGDSECHTKHKNDFNIKLHFAIDDKQNQKTVKCDFSGTQPSNDNTQLKDIEKINCASHVVESGLIIEFIKFYALEKYLSQPILDRIRLILPPKSVLSTPHKQGFYNFELQKTVRQMVKNIFGKINSTDKKKDHKLNLYSTYLAQITSQDKTNSFFLSNSRVQFDHFSFFKQVKLQNLDGEYQAELIYTHVNEGLFKLYGIQSSQDQNKRWIKLNNELIHTGAFTLKKNDTISFNWKI